MRILFPLIRLWQTGAKVDMTDTERRNLVTVNIISFATLVAALIGPSIIYFTIAPELPILIAGLTEAALFLLVIWLNKLYYYKTATVLCYLITNLAILIFGILLDKSAGVQQMGMFLFGLAFLIFDKIAYRLFAFATTIILLGILELNYYKPIFKPIAIITENNYEIRAIVYPVIIVLDILIVALWAYNNSYLYRKLKEVYKVLKAQNSQITKQKEQLEEANLKLAVTNLRLEETNNKLEISNQKLEESNRRIVIANRQLHETNKKLEDANQAKEAYVIEMSHELRNPLNNINLITNVLHENMPPAAPENFIMATGSLRSVTNIISQIVSNNLEIAAINNGKSDPVKNELIEVSDWILAITQNNHFYAASKSITISYNINDDVPKFLWSDKTKLFKILNNLVINAIKYSGAFSRVSISINVLPNKTWQLKISDTGAGIKPEKMEQIFTPYYTEGSATNSTGLGLSLVKNLVESLNGNIRVDSELFKGTTFTLQFPLIEKLETSSSPTGINKSGSSIDLSNVYGKVLLIEDDPVARQMLKLIFSKTPGITLVMANDQPEVIKLLDEGLRPSCVIMDYLLPNQSDPFYLLKKIRDYDGLHDLKIICVSGNTEAQTHQNMMDAGASMFVAKPMNMEIIKRAVYESCLVVAPLNTDIVK